MEKKGIEKHMTNTVIHVGASREAIEAATDSVVKIFETGRSTGMDQAVISKGLDLLEAAFEGPDSVNVSDCDLKLNIDADSGARD